MNVFFNKGTEENAKNLFENTFMQNHIYLNEEDGVFKPVDIDEFIDYYESVYLMILEDDTFKEIMLKSWELMPVDEVLKKEAKKEIKKEEPPKKEEIPKEKEKSEKIPTEEIKQRIENVEERLEKEKEFSKNLLKEQNIDIFREAIGGKGISTVINFINQLRQYDRKGDKEISFEDFCEILKNINLHITEKDTKLLFSDFSGNNSKMNYGNFYPI